MPPASPEAREAELVRAVADYVCLQQWDNFSSHSRVLACSYCLARVTDLLTPRLDAVRAARDAELRAGIETLPAFASAFVAIENLVDRAAVLTLLTPET